MILQFFKKYFFSKRSGAVVKSIAWLTLFAVTISVTALVVVLSVMTKLNVNIEERTLAIEPHLRVTSLTNNADVRLFAQHPITQSFKKPGITAHLYESQDLIIRTLDGHFRGAQARGLSRDGLKFIFTQMEKVKRHQRLAFDFQLPLEDFQPGDVILGIDLAVSLGVLEGDLIMLIPPEALLMSVGDAPKFENVRVRKIVSTSLADVDSQTVFYIQGETLKTNRAPASRKQGFEIWLKDLSDVEDVKTELSHYPGVKVETWKEMSSALFLVLRLEKLVISLFLTLAALVSGLSMMSVMVLLISQKQKEISILQAMGMARRKVQELFFSLGLSLASVGILSGVILGSLISLYMQYNPISIPSDVYYDSYIGAQWSPWFIFSVLFVGLLLSAWGSYLSSKSVLQMTVVEALSRNN